MANSAIMLARNARRVALLAALGLLLPAVGCSGGDNAEESVPPPGSDAAPDTAEQDSGGAEAASDAAKDGPAIDSSDAKDAALPDQVSEQGGDAPEETVDASIDAITEPGLDADSADFGGDETGPCDQQPEICNGLDDNCNGTKDEGDPGGGIACSVPGKLGECAAGITHCANGAVKCISSQPPSQELCDGKDNDCDGQIDGLTTDSGGSCNTSKPGVCAAGTLTCEAGALVCKGSMQPSTESCNGLDDDCDGTVDNGFPGTGLPCVVPGQNPNTPCAQGQTNCFGGQNGCTQMVFPEAETCDGADNDCNGTIDDAGMVQGLTCSTGAPGICASGKTQCAGGKSTCVPDVQPGAVTETCNGKDDDCDGQTDDLADVKIECSTKYPGAQNVSTWACSTGACQVFSCTANHSDCDGALTNGCEVSSGTDIANCGGCGNVCSSSNGTAMCVVGKCQLQCNAGHGNCDGNADNGCEADLLTDTGHCGTCATVCPTQNGTALCKTGVCSVNNAPHTGTSLVAGGVVASSANYRVIMTLGQSPGGNATHSSANYMIVGGLVGATQKP
jgi:hypothetical protein